MHLDGYSKSERCRGVHSHPPMQAPFAGACAGSYTRLVKLMVVIGLERCLEECPKSLVDARFGLLMNQASVDHRFRYACDVLAERFPNQLRALYTPQHGLWSEQQANMIESPHGHYEPLDIP